jgi:hypothetical protein
MLSGLLLSIVSTPINTIKTPLMISANSNTKSIIYHIYKCHGYNGFYRGWIGTLARDVLWNGLYFPLYSYFNNYLDNRLYCGILAGCCSVCVTYPFDGIRLYRQNHKDNYNFWHGFRKAFNMSFSNIKSFAICMIRVPLSVAFSHWTYLRTAEFLNE